MSRVYVVRCQKSPDGKCKVSLSGSGIRTVHAEPQRRRDLAASLCPNEQFLNRLTETEGEKVLNSRCAVCMHPTTNPSYRIEPNSLSKLCSFDQLNHSFQAYAVSIEEMNSRSDGRCSGSLERNWKYDAMINNPIPKLRRAPQPPLSRPGATPDSDRAKRPPLAEPAASDQELIPGDRVEGLGNFGKPTGELGTVELANEDDAVVKWDDDGRTRLAQPSLKKI